MALSGPKLKVLNKEEVSHALLEDFDFSPEFVCEIVECIWRSKESRPTLHAPDLNTSRPHIGDPCINCGATTAKVSKNPCPGR